MAVKIITDSTCDISLERAAELGIEVVCLKVTIDGVTYVDKAELSCGEFYKKLAQCKETPVTSLASPDDFIKVFSKYPDDDIVGVFISSRLSGTYQSAVIAKEELKRDNIWLVDSQSVACGLAILVEYGVKMRDERKSAAEIAQKLSELAPKTGIHAAVDTLKYLVKGGRLSGVAGAFGTLLKIKPILTVKGGEVLNTGKEKGMAAAMERLKKTVDEAEIFEEAGYYGGHTDAEAECLEFLKKLGLENSPICSIGSVVGTHAGPKAIAVAFVRK